MLSRAGEKKVPYRSAASGPNPGPLISVFRLDSWISMGTVTQEWLKPYPSPSWVSPLFQGTARLSQALEAYLSRGLLQAGRGPQLFWSG